MNVNIKEIAFLFLKLGLIGFGGPAAHIAMMRDEVVRRREWMTDDEFLDLVGITNLIPGPNSTEMAIHVGKIQGGTRGLIVAGLSFILPAVALTLLISVMYIKYGSLPEVLPFIYGIKPAIIAIILTAIIPLVRTSLKNSLLALIGISSLLLSFLYHSQILIMVGAGLVYMLINIVKSKGVANYTGSLLFVPLTLTGQVGAAVSSGQLFFIFLKIGAILYGSGYVLFAFLDSELVLTGLMTRAQLVDAIAIGQMTPGPVFSSVTFIGYLLDGWKGAFFSTIGVFLPSFIFIALLSRVFNKLKESPLFMSFLAGVNVASVALIVAVAVVMAKESLYDWRTILIGLVSLVVAFHFRRVNSAFIVVGAAVAGYLLSMV